MLGKWFRRVVINHRVNKGVLLLDARAEGWRARVDVDTLDLASTTLCVLGQVFGTYSHGRTILNISGDSSNYGFVSYAGTPKRQHLDYAELKRVWTERLKEAA